MTASCSIKEATTQRIFSPQHRLVLVQKQRDPVSSLSNYGDKSLKSGVWPRSMSQGGGKLGKGEQQCLSSEAKAVDRLDVEPLPETLWFMIQSHKLSIRRGLLKPWK